MPVPSWAKAPFLPGQYYHLVCKCHDGLSLFNTELDRNVFLERYFRFMKGFSETWAYILLNNHTHHICKIRSVEQLSAHIQNVGVAERSVPMLKWMENKDNDQLLDAMVERQMNRFLVSYVNYYNYRYERGGSLFRRPFRRIQIMSEGHLQQAIIYVHANAVKHGIDNEYRGYRYSSYSLMMENNNDVQSADVLRFFGNADKYISAHHEQISYFYRKGWPSSRIE